MTQPHKIREEGSPVVSSSVSTPDVLASTISPDWIAPNNRPADHGASINSLSAQMPDANARGLRRDKSIFEDPIPILKDSPLTQWPMDSFEPSPFPPPWPGPKDRAAMCRESASLHPEAPLGPLASHWVDQLVEWYERLQKHFEFNPANLAMNVRVNAHKWRRRLSFLAQDQKELFRFIVDFIENGHTIPFASPPPKYFRKANPPSLKADKVRAWAAIKRDMDHGAIIPANIEKEGLPWCICPVRTADKSNGTARFVHNTRHLNKRIDDEHTKCSLETLLKTRNMYMQDGFLIGSDYQSGYHCVYVRPEDRKYLGFALHLSELTDDARKWLFEHFPNAYYHKKRCFIFFYAVLPFGLGSSCKVFNSLICALVSFWRRCDSDGHATRASSYIDDIASAVHAFSLAMRTSIRMVYEAASLGLSLQIRKKCSFFPRHAMVVLGTIVDLKTYTFRVSTRRAQKIGQAINNLESAVHLRPSAVPAKLVATFIGLIWSIASCCQRAASVMTRNIISVLSVSMRQRLQSSYRPLKQILSAFWSGSVRWSSQAHSQLLFWKDVNFLSLRAPISADVLGKSAELVFQFPAYLNTDNTTLLCQDASDTASGGGIISPHGNELRYDPNHLYLSRFSGEESDDSSTYREILGIWRCLLAIGHLAKAKIIFACDNYQTVLAVKFGSRIPKIQQIAQWIFHWCILSGKICWPIWLPRDHPVIKESDRRSRLVIPHDVRSPPEVVDAANAMAIQTWALPLSFDQAASHQSAIKVHGSPLPFNSFCWQPGCAGVDMFVNWSSWTSNINYVFPPHPMVGRLVTFLPSTNARSVVVLPLPIPTAWWSYAVLPGARGVVAQQRCKGFLITAFDFRPTPSC